MKEGESTTEVEGWNAIVAQIESLIEAVTAQVRSKTFQSTDSRVNLMKLDKKLSGALELAKKAAEVLRYG